MTSRSSSGFVQRAFILLATLASVLLSAPLGAQSSLLIEGTVVLGGVPVPEATIDLHRVTRDTAGVVTRTTADRDGSFRFEKPLVVPTGGFVVHFTTAEHLGVRYFGPPVHGDETVDSYRIEVFDTVHVNSTDARPLIARRDIVLISEARGGWEVNELLVIRNPGERTLVSPSGMPIWELRLPDGAEGFEVGEGELAPDAVQRMGDRVLLTGSLQPGDRDLLLRYRIGPGRGAATFPVDAPTGMMNLLVRQPAPAVEVSGLGGGGEMAVEGERFVRFGSANVAAGTLPTLSWAGASGPPVSPVAAALGVLGLLLVVSAVYAYRRREMI